GDLAGVLNTVLDRAARLCGAERASIHLLDGDVYRTAAFWGPTNPEYKQVAYDTTRKPGRETLIGRTALDRAVVHIPHVLADHEPVVDAIALTTTRYCGAQDAGVLLVDGDVLVRVAHHGPLPMSSGPRLPIDRNSVAARAILERRTVHVADIEGAEGEDFPDTRARAAAAGQRGTLAAPMLREGAPIGVILLRKTEPTGFSPS